jgi:hypothetical protein
MTIETAARVTRLRACKVCAPELIGQAGIPVRSLSVTGLGDHHIGAVLATPGGVAIGAILEIVVRRTINPVGDRGLGEVIVTTENGPISYGANEEVHLWARPNAVGLARRETKVRMAVGAFVN